MASNHTNNYNLCQWEATDAVLRTDFNEDNTKIDAALKSQAGSISSLSAQMANKANTGTVSSLSTTVSQKADRSELEAEVSARVQADNAEKAAREAADAENMATLRGENCWVKLSDETLSGSAESYTFSIANPGLYTKLECRFTVDATENLYFSINQGALMIYENGSTRYDKVLLSGLGQKGMGGCIELLPLREDGNVLIYYKAGGLSEQDSLFIQDRIMSTIRVTYNQGIALKISTDGGTLSAGSRFILYGLKR